MWASCDVGMRPSILEMIFVIVLPGVLLSRPPYAFGVVALALCTLAAVGLKRLYAPFGVRAQIILTIGLAAGAPFVALATYYTAVALGVHPTSGQCVI
jgi:hypothetical protein